MKRKHILLVTIVAITILLVVLIGYRQVTPTPAPQEDAPQEPALQEPDTKSLEDYEEVVVWSTWQPGASGIPIEPTATKLHQYLMDRFKIDIFSESHWLTGDDQHEFINMAIAADNLPDVVNLFKGDVWLVNRMVDAGMLIEIEPLLQLMPTYQKHIAGGVIEAFRREDGKIYVLPGGTVPMYGAEELRIEPTPWFSYVYRYDIVEQLGLTLPTTPDELYNVLVKVRDANLTTPEGRSIIPFVGDYGAFAASLGINRHRMKVNEAEQRMVSHTELPEYLEYLKFMSRLYRERLIPLDFLVLSGAEEMALWTEGRVAFGTISAPDIMLHESELKRTLPDARIEPMPMIMLEGMEMTYQTRIDTTGITVTGLNRKIEDPERFAKFYNWATTMEGINVIGSGPPGKDPAYYIWHIDELGRHVANEGRHIMGPNEDWTKNVNELGAWSICINPVVLISFDPRESTYYDVDWMAEQGVETQFHRALQMNRNTTYKNLLEEIFGMQPEGEILREKGTSVGMILEEHEAIIFTTAKDDADVERMFNRMREELKAAGLIEILKEDYAGRYLRARELIK